MAEFKLDLIGNTENLTANLKSLQDSLSQVGEEAKKSGKEVQESLNQPNSTDKLQRSITSQVLLLSKYEIELKKLRKELAATFDPKVAEGLTKQIDATTNSLIQLDAESETMVKTSSSLRGQLIQNKDALSQMEAQGLDATETFMQLSIATAQLQDQINDTNERVKFFASDTKGFDALLSMAKASAAVFSVAQGAMALFGVENENVQKALLKVNAAMAILNGLTEIQKSLEKSSTARITVETLLRKAKIFVLGEEAAATTALTAAQYAGAVGAKVLRAALLATGAGAVIFLITQIAELVSAMSSMKDETSLATDEIEKQKKALEDYRADLEYFNNKQLLDAKKLGANDETLRAIAAQGRKDEIAALEKDAQDKKALYERTQEEAIRAVKKGNNDEAKLALEQFEASKKAYEESLGNLTELRRRNILQSKQDSIDSQKETEERDAKYNEDQLKKQQEYLRRKRAIEDENNANSIAAMADGQEKELAQLEESKRKEIRAARESGASITLITAKFAKERTDILLKYDKIRLDNEKAVNDFLEQNMMNADNTDRKALENKLKFLDNLEEIKKLELDLEFESGDKSIKEAERIATEKLNVEIEFAKKRLEILQADNTLGVNDNAIAALKLAIKKAQNEIADIGKGDSKLLESLGLGDITDEQLQSIKDNISIVSESIKSILSEGLENAIDSNRNFIDDLNAQIQSVSDNIDRQKQLQLEGQANNLEAEKENLARLEEERRKALERDKKLQREKLTLDGASQLSSLITASAKIFEAYAGLPFIGQALSIAAVAAMFSAFAISQVRARQAISQQTFGKGGKIKGKRHDADGWGGERFVSDSGNETYLEDGEWVINRKASQKYDRILEAINNDNLFNLLKGTGVSLNEKKVDNFRQLKNSYADNEIKHRIRLENEMGNGKIEEFKKSFEKHMNKKKTEIRFENGYRIETRGNRTIRTKLNG